MIRDPACETISRDELSSLQLKRLQAKVKNVYDNVPFYRRSFDEANVIPDDLRSLSDMSRFPFTRKVNFRDNYPFGLLACPVESLVRVHSSSGTTGKPTIGPYTQADIEMWSEVMARTLATSGVTSQDVVQNAYGYGLFTGGLGFHYGAERLGATVIPTGGGNTRRQIALLQDLGTTVLTCTPSYALIVAETAEEMGVDLVNSQLRLAVCGAEPWSELMRKDIERRLGVCAIDIYGLTEVVGPGVSVECEHQCGLHVAEDHFLVEIIDPDSGEPVPYGETGELVITTLTREAQPVIRFRTSDIVSLNPEPCECGRTHARMSKVSGRNDDMLVVRGVNVFPSQIESVLLRSDGVTPQYLIVVEKKTAFSTDQLEVWVEVSDDGSVEDPLKLEQLGKKLQTEMNSVLGIHALMRLVGPKTIRRPEGKAQRVVERSQLTPSELSVIRQ